MNYSFRLGVKYRAKSGDYRSSGDCGHGKFIDEKSDEAMLGCGVDCDGGGIDVRWRRATKPRSSSSSVSASGKDKNYDEDAAQDWLLERTTRHSGSIDTLKDCESLVTDRKELAAMRHK